MTARAASPGPVSPVVLPDGRKVWMVRGYGAARAVLGDPGLSNDTRAMGDKAPLASLPPEVRNVVARDMLNNDPPEHTRLRQLVAHAFTARQAARFRPTVRRLAGELLDGLGDVTSADLVASYATPLPTLVLGALIGIPPGDAPQVRQWSETFVSELLTVSDTLLDATTSLLAYTRDLVARRGADPAGDDLVARLRASGLDDDQLASMVFVLLIAGQTATTQLIAKSAHLLLTHPAELDRVRARRSLMAGAVDESLRLDPPLTVSAFRMTTTTLTVDGTSIPAGEIVLCSLSDTGRDASRFSEPERFDVGREDNAHLAFGHGLHRCLGANLAKVEAETALDAFFQRFPHTEMEVSTQDLPWVETGIMRKLMGLPVRLRPA